MGSPSESFLLEQQHDDDDDSDNGEKTQPKRGGETPQQLPGSQQQQQQPPECTRRSGTSQSKRHGARNHDKMKHFMRWLMETFPDELAAAKAATLAAEAAEEASPLSDITKTKCLSDKNLDMSNVGNDTAAANDGDTNKKINSQHQQQDVMKKKLVILDVAGGKGELAVRMSLCHQLSVVMVDPRVADVVRCCETVVLPNLPSKWQTRVRQNMQADPDFIQNRLCSSSSNSSGGRFQQLVMPFTEATLASSRELQKAVESAVLLIGMHADNATEAIVDAALHYQKPFVVVPCCVFPNLFPQRNVEVVEEQESDEHDDASDKKKKKVVVRQVQVRTHEQFCQFLLEKDERFRQSVLRFEGRNVAMWWDGKGNKTADPTSL
eukprot:GHVN01013034.1.p1 GENE.GHVN01013034.1~~GHVN01013034.1.p1  ORF type:complete len:379 (+),score=47.98 GHVN01013034.1:316-1452(+)